jgi:CBS-domain-containing membrane protein
MAKQGCARDVRLHWRDGMNAADLMTRDVVTIDPEAPLADAIRLMLRLRVSGLPVVDSAGRLIGLLTEGDLLHRIETGTEAPRMGWIQALVARGRMAEHYVHSHGRRVQDVMTRDVVTVGEQSSVTDIVRIMESKHFRRVPVVDGERLVGVVSRSDLVRILGTLLAKEALPDKSDREIRACILAEMERHRWAPGRNVLVMVIDGEVELHGEIFDERMRSAMRVIAEGVPGVKAVEDGLMLVDPNSVLVYGV